MSKTTTVAPPAHVLLRRTDERGRVGALHAALGTADGWRTACGALLVPTSTIEVWNGRDGLAVLAQPGARECARCQRVGDAVES